jgi:hypothetical protein
MARMSDQDTPTPGLVSRLLRRDPHRLPDRVWQLERDVAECRNLSLRVAELTDLVGELLVELARADPERAATVLDRYRDELGG